MADDAAGADADKSPTTLRLLHSTPSTAGLSSHGPVSAGAPTTGGSSIGASPSPGASIDIDIDNGDDDDGELLALRPSRAGSQPRPSCSARLGPARPLSAPSHSHSSASGQGDGDGDGDGDEYMPTPRTFETAVSSAPRSARQETFLLASARSHSSSLHSSGYGWYEEDEEVGGGGAHYVGSIGRGHEAHLQVLGRMETMREDLEATVHTAMGGTSTRRLASMAVTDADADGNIADADAAAIMKEVSAEERARVVARASSAQQQGRQGPGPGPEGAGEDKQVLFVLAQKDFSVTTKQFAVAHCGPLLLELVGGRGGGAGSEQEGEGEEPPAAAAAKHEGKGASSVVAFASGAGATPTHNRKGRAKKAASLKQPPPPPPQDCFLALGVGGFRIVQTGGGNQHAEYNVIVCTNALTHVAWRRYTEFAALMEAARAAHGDSQLPQTGEAWAALERRRKWRRCLSVPYLAAKLTHLELFLQALVAELASPVLLLRFVSGDGAAGRA